MHKKRNRDIKNQEKRVIWENNVKKSRDKGVLCNNVPWDDADNKVRCYIFLYLGSEGQRQLQQKRPRLDIQKRVHANPGRYILSHKNYSF